MSVDHSLIAIVDESPNFFRTSIGSAVHRRLHPSDLYFPFTNPTATPIMKPNSWIHSPPGANVSDEDKGQLPPMLQAILGRLGIDSIDDDRLGVWLPTLMAAGAAGQSALVLASTLRGELRGERDEPMEWPVDDLRELRDTLLAIGDALPGVDESMPALSEAIEAGEAYLDADAAQDILLNAAGHLESLSQRAIGAIIEAAFFARDKRSNPARHHREIKRLFRRLEGLFDKALALWLQPPTPSD